jgi:hypothetical protein
VKIKQKELIRGIPYTREQLEKLRYYDLWTIAAALAVPKRPDGKYGPKEKVIPEILEAQERHDERMTPYCEMCGKYTMLREKAHICSEGDASRENILMLCVSCHRMLDVHLKPRLYLALKRFGAKGLPSSWEKSIFQQAFDASMISRDKPQV